MTDFYKNVTVLKILRLKLDNKNICLTYNNVQAFQNIFASTTKTC